MQRTLVPVLALLGLAGTLAAQTPTYEPLMLAAPDEAWAAGSWPSSVNDSGVVVGNTYISGWKHGWVGSPTMPMQLLPLPPDATNSDVLDINSSGVAVGQVRLETGVTRAIVWSPDGGGYDYLLLPNGPGGQTPFSATGINDAGDVVGKYGVLAGQYYWNETDGIVQITSAEFPVTPGDVNERREIVGRTYRLDLDTMVLENLGFPTGLGYGLIATELRDINDAGECVGYATAATSSNYKYLPVRHTDGAGAPVWKVFSSKQLSANAWSIAAAGDTVFHLGVVGNFLWVDGIGSLSLQGLLDPAFAGWNLTGSTVPVISRGGLLAARGADPGGESGIVLLTPTAFEDLGGATRGALGDPVLNGFGTLQPGAPTRLRLSSAAPNSLAFLFWSSSSAPLAFVGGTFHANPFDLFVRLPTNALGRIDKTFDWPDVPVGYTSYQQFVVLDAESPYGATLSNAVRNVTQ